MNCHPPLKRLHRNKGVKKKKKERNISVHVNAACATRRGNDDITVAQQSGDACSPLCVISVRQWPWVARFTRRGIMGPSKKRARLNGSAEGPLETGEDFVLLAPPPAPHRPHRHLWIHPGDKGDIKYMRLSSFHWASRPTILRHNALTVNQPHKAPLNTGCETCYATARRLVIETFFFFFFFLS